jgi:hypothetical protein
MKKGCFYIGIMIFTIVVAIIFYFYKTNKSFFADLARDKIINKAVNELTVMIDTTIHSSYNDSLKVLLKEYKTRRKIPKFEEAMEDLSNLMRNVKAVVKDKKIDTLKYVELKNFVKENERSKKNRN